jgi:hypothetical protein
MKKLIIGFVFCCIALAAQAQSTIQVRPNQFGGGYNIQYPNGGTVNVRPNPFGGGYDAYGPQGLQWQSRPNQFGGGYDVRTMPRSYGTFNR